MQNEIHSLEEKVNEQNQEMVRSLPFMFGFVAECRRHLMATPIICRSSTEGTRFSPRNDDVSITNVSEGAGQQLMSFSQQVHPDLGALRRNQLTQAKMAGACELPKQGIRFPL